MRLNLRIRGENIVGVDSIENQYAARDIAALAEEQPLQDVLPLVERTCATAGGAYRLALCLAAEAACGTRIPRGARLTRTLFAEVERMLARLWLLASVARALGLPMPMREALEQRESLYDALTAATNARVFGAIAVPGGARTDLNLAPLETALARFAAGMNTWRLATAERGPIGKAGARLGTVSPQLVRDAHLGGIAATGTSNVEDVRRAEPYDGYEDITVQWPDQQDETNDVAGRMRRAVTDLATSHSIARACLAVLMNERPEPPAPLEPGSYHVEPEVRVEGPHGPMRLSCAFAPDLSVSTLEIITAAHDVYNALPDLLTGTPLRQLPAFLASLDLCMECVDQ